MKTQLSATAQSQVVSLRAGVGFDFGGVEVDFDKAIIKGAALMQCMPARGHGFSIDRTALQQVHDLIAAKGGVPVRFKHPREAEVDDSQYDPLGTDVGYVRNVRIEGDCLRGDVHLMSYAEVLPGLGNVKDYLLRKAKDDPRGFGMSAVIAYDVEETTNALGTVELVARVGAVEAVDFVSDPAATRHGLLAAKQTNQQGGRKGDSSGTSDPNSKSNKPAGQKTAELNSGASTMKYSAKFKAILSAHFGLAADADEAAAEEFFGKMAEADQQKCADMSAEEEKAVEQAAMAARLAVRNKRAGKSNGGGTDTVISNDGDDELLALEKKRVARLKTLGETLDIGEDVVEQEIAKGSDVAAARKAFLANKLKKASPEQTAGLGGNIAVGTAGEAQKVTAMRIGFSDAILMRSGLSRFYVEDARGRIARDIDGKPKVRAAHETADKYVGLSILDMHRHWLLQMGANREDVDLLSRAQLCDLLSRRNLQRKFPRVAMLAQSTSDFDNVLLDAQNKTLRLGYVEMTPTWQLWARRGTAPDFKNINRIQISEVPTPTARAEGGPIVYTTLIDSKETYALAEYASGVILTRRTLINDDTSVFTDVPRKQGQSAARLEDDTAYAIITANAALADTGTLFNSTAYTVGGTGHQNQVTTTAGKGAPSVATVSAAEKLMMVQQGPKAAGYLGLTPKFWLGPVALKTTAEQFFASRVDPSKYNDTPNPYNGKITPISNPRFDANSAVKWYLLADHRDGQIDTVEVCFLADEPEPTLKAETSFDTDDQKYAVIHVVAAKALDFRGMVYNPGA